MYTRNKIQYIILFNANIFTSALMKIDVLSAVLWTGLYKHKGHGEMWLWMRRLKIAPRYRLWNRTKCYFHIFYNVVVPTLQFWYVNDIKFRIYLKILLYGLCCANIFILSITALLHRYNSNAIIITQFTHCASKFYSRYSAFQIHFNSMQ